MSAAAIPSAAMFAGHAAPKPPKPKASAHPSLLAAQATAGATVSAGNMDRNAAMRMMQIVLGWLAKMARRILGGHSASLGDPAQQGTTPAPEAQATNKGGASLDSISSPGGAADDYMAQTAGGAPAAPSQADDDLKYHAQWILDALSEAVKKQSYITKQTPGNEAVDQAQILLHQIKSALEFYAEKKISETAATRSAIRPLAESISATPDMVLRLIRQGIIPASDPRIAAAAAHLQRLDALEQEIAATSLCFDSFLDMAADHEDRRIKMLAASYMTAVRPWYVPADQRKTVQPAPAPAQPMAARTSDQATKSTPPSPQTSPWVAPAESTPEKPATIIKGKQGATCPPKSPTIQSPLPGAISMASMRRFAMSGRGSPSPQAEEPPELDDPNDSPPSPT